MRRSASCLALRPVIVGREAAHTASLRSLRYAEALARSNDSLLIPGTSVDTPGCDLADRRAPLRSSAAFWAEESRPATFVRRSAVVLRRDPGCLPFRSGRSCSGARPAGPVHTSCNPGDLLVVGICPTGRPDQGGYLRKVCHYYYCVTHAPSPVLIDRSAS